MKLPQLLSSFRTVTSRPSSGTAAVQYVHVAPFFFQFIHDRRDAAETATVAVLDGVDPIAVVQVDKRQG